MNTAITKGEEIKIKYIELHFIIPCCRKTKTASKKNISTATQRFDLAFTKKWEAGSFSCYVFLDLLVKNRQHRPNKEFCFVSRGKY